MKAKHFKFYLWFVSCLLFLNISSFASAQERKSGQDEKEKMFDLLRDTQQELSLTSQSLKELKEGTEEEKFSLIDLFKKGEKFAQYVYSEKAYAHILTCERQPFLVLRLFLEPGGQTKLEQDPLELGNYQKWAYGLKGKITCVVGKERFLLRKSEALCFNSNVAHSFQNNTGQKCACLIIQNPKHI